VARDKINEIIVSFAKLQYDAFDPANSHHWRDHVSWFKRRVTLINKKFRIWEIVTRDNLMSGIAAAERS